MKAVGKSSLYRYLYRAVSDCLTLSPLGRKAEIVEPLQSEAIICIL